MASDDIKPKLSGQDFLDKLKETGFTDKTIEALQDEDLTSDTAMKLLTSSDIEKFADDRKLTLGQKRLLVEFATSMRPKRERSKSKDRSESTRSSRRGPPSGPPPANIVRTKSRSPLSDRRRPTKPAAVDLHRRLQSQHHHQGVSTLRDLW